MTTKVIIPLSKKAITAGVSHAGEKIGKMAADKGVEKSGNLIQKMLNKRRGTNAPQTRGSKTTAKKVRKTEAYDVSTMINNLIAST